MLLLHGEGEVDVDGRCCVNSIILNDIFVACSY